MSDFAWKVLDALFEIYTNLTILLVLILVGLIGIQAIVKLILRLRK